jgi:succinate-semialdehyde dehydrogenase/glutarate-semialdehyde dehydrogenase
MNEGVALCVEVDPERARRRVETRYLDEVADDLDDAIARANSLPYALAAYGFTHDLRLAHRLARELQAGMVGINHFGVSQPETPFGGVKDSGLGHESGLEGLLGYTEVKLVSVAG